MADAVLLFEVDNDPDVMRFINGGIHVPRVEIAEDVLPAFIGYYQHGDGYGFWAAIEKNSNGSAPGSIDSTCDHNSVKGRGV